MRVPRRLAVLGSGVFLFAAFAGVRAWGQEYSHVRIVRLSFTEGTVSVQRPDVAEWAEAPTNTPIEEGFKLQTDENSFAEVEFENSSTARLGQLSLLEFTQLALAPSGAKANRITLHKGYATFNTLPEGDDFYQVMAGNATLTPHGKTRFRVDFEDGMVMVKVFKGSVEVLSPEGTGTLGKNTVLQILPGSEEPFQLSQGITKDAWDEWVEERESRVEMARSVGGPMLYSANVNDLMFGVMDLVYYGNWVNLPGYGPGWLPAAGPGWSPFTLGRWCWYPSFGYTWISYEPWGWLPYHYGAWIYDPIIGWCWIPTGVNVWQPAVVNWYRGPGWVGWAPMSPVSGGTQSYCPQTQGCVTTVSDDVFRNGRPIHPDGVRWTNRVDGQPIARPELAPEHQAWLPGDRYTGTGAFRGEVGGSTGRMLPGRTPVATGQTGNPPARTSTDRVFPNFPAANAIGSPTPASNERGIVFDPDQGRYVNNPSGPRAPVSAPATAARPSAGTSPPASGLIGRQPGPRENYPVPTATGVYSTRPGSDRTPANAPGAVQSGKWDTRDRSPSDLFGSRGVGARSKDTSSGASSSSRSAPSGAMRSEGSSGTSRAGSAIGSSSRSESGVRSGGSNLGASSSGRSGGWSGGSSGGAHSPGSGGGVSSGGGSRGSVGGGGASSGGGHSNTDSRR
jgi:hypothetical protein